MSFAPAPLLCGLHCRDEAACADSDGSVASVGGLTKALPSPFQLGKSMRISSESEGNPLTTPPQESSQPESGQLKWVLAYPTLLRSEPAPDY